MFAPVLFSETGRAITRRPTFEKILLWKPHNLLSEKIVNDDDFFIFHDVRTLDFVAFSFWYNGANV